MRSLVIVCLAVLTSTPFSQIPSSAKKIRAIFRGCAQGFKVADKIEDRLGSLEVGKDADLFLATGDPLDMKTDVKILIINGKPIDMAN